MSEFEKLMQGVLDTHPIGRNYAVSVIHTGIEYEAEIADKRTEGILTRFQAKQPGDLMRRLNACILKMEEWK